MSHHPDQAQSQNDLRGRVGSVVYRMEPGDRDVEEGILSYAQSVAIEQRLPLAVVFCLDESEQSEPPLMILDQLRGLEKKLAVVHVPLMVLVGDSAQRFEWFSGYVKPARVVTRRSPQRAQPPTSHPHPWPGTVITVDELMAMIEKGQISCR